MNKKFDAVRVREAKKKDVDGICEVEESSFPEDERYSRSKFLSRLSGPPFSAAYERKYFVALDTSSDKIIGYAEAAIQDPEVTLFGDIDIVEKYIGLVDQKVGGLISLAVIQEYRNHGAGSKLLKARLDYFASNGINQIFTQAWPNGGFTHLAKKFDFEKIPEWRGRRYCDGTYQELYFKDISLDKGMSRNVGSKK